MTACESLATKAELDELRSQLNGLSAELDKKADKQEIDRLNNEIETLKQEVEGLKRDLDQKADKSELIDLKNTLEALIQAVREALENALTNAIEGLKDWVAITIQAQIDILRAFIDTALAGLRALIDSLFGDRDEYVKKGSGITLRLSTDGGSISASVDCDLGFSGDTTLYGFDLSDYAQKGSGMSVTVSFVDNNLGVNVSSALGAAADSVPIDLSSLLDQNDIDLSEYVKKGSGIDISSSIVQGGINLGISCQLGSDSQLIPLDLSGYVTKREFDEFVAWVQAELNAALTLFYALGELLQNILQSIAQIAQDLQYEINRLRDELANKVDKNIGLNVGAGYNNGILTISVIASQIGSDTASVSIVSNGDGSGDGDTNIYRYYYDNPDHLTKEDLYKSYFNVSWDGASLNFDVMFAGYPMSTSVLIPELLDIKTGSLDFDKNNTDFNAVWDGESLVFYLNLFGRVFDVSVPFLGIPVNVDLVLTEKDDGDELEVIVYVGGSSDSDKVKFMSSQTVNKIYQILGGDRWFPQDGQPPKFNPEGELITRAMLTYDTDSNLKDTVGVETPSIIDLIWLSQAPNYQKLGLKDYPANVPTTLLKHLRGTKTIGSLADWLGWFIRSFDGLIGEFPIDIKITDADLLQEGEQELNIRIHNIAEGLKELWGIGFNSRMIEDAILETTMRDLMETGASRKMGIVNHYVIKSIQEYLGFKVKEQELEIDFSFDPGVAAKNDASNLWEFLQASTQKIKIDDCDEDKSFERDLMVLLEAARIVKGSLFHTWRGVDSEKQRIKDALDEFDKNSDDFDIWLEKIETGFINDAALDDTANPYGRPFSQRPRVKDVGNDQVEPQ